MFKKKKAQKVRYQWRLNSRNGGLAQVATTYAVF